MTQVNSIPAPEFGLTSMKEVAFSVSGNLKGNCCLLATISTIIDQNELIRVYKNKRKSLASIKTTKNNSNRS